MEVFVVMKKIKLPCGGIVETGENLLEEGSTFLCSKGHEHSTEEIKKSIQAKQKESGKNCYNKSSSFRCVKDTK